MGQEFTMYHQHYIHTEVMLSAKDVSRAGKKQGQGCVQWDRQTHKGLAVNVQMTATNKTMPRREARNGDMGLIAHMWLSKSSHEEQKLQSS